MTRTQEIRAENDPVKGHSSTRPLSTVAIQVHDKPFYLSVQKPTHALEVILAQMRSTPATLPDGIYKAVPMLSCVPQYPCQDDTDESVMYVGYTKTNGNTREK